MDVCLHMGLTTLFCWKRHICRICKFPDLRTASMALMTCTAGNWTNRVHRGCIIASPVIRCSKRIGINLHRTNLLHRKTHPLIFSPSFPSLSHSLPLPLFSLHITKTHDPRTALLPSQIPHQFHRWLGSPRTNPKTARLASIFSHS